MIFYKVPNNSKYLYLLNFEQLFFLKININKIVVIGLEEIHFFANKLFA